MSDKKKGNFIQKAIKRKGAFTAEARSRGITVDELIKRVKANPDNYSLLMRRRANLAHTLKNLSKKK